MKDKSPSGEMTISSGVPTASQPPVEVKTAVPQAKRRTVEATATFESREYLEYQGPVPPPQIIEGWEKMLPGAADRILKMAEGNALHRQFMEKTVITSDVSKSWWGLVFAFIVSMTVVVGGCVLIGLNHDWAGTAIITGGLSGLVGTFIYGHHVRKEERVAKNQAVPQPPPPAPPKPAAPQIAK